MYKIKTEEFIMEAIDIIIDLKKRLTETQFKVFYLKTVKDMSFAAISDIIGISPCGARDSYATSLRIVRKLRMTYKLHEDTYRYVKAV